MKLSILLGIIILIFLVIVSVIIYLRNRSYVYPVGKCFDQNQMKSCVNNCNGKCKGNIACNCDIDKNNLPKRCEDLKNQVDCLGLYGGAKCGCRWNGRCYSK